ncbi:hypothetical protein K432DRAFT_14174 [Lepidopterella palustris CBS 459.81]|uniref:Uncharacterized protein n=1 Tax=Lepidopterella palustris CBS 459.81 TaxID=1314670 RepID=A0A8E2DX58_9PEZI|nr:hypothetical protein K432DRAFT_14174 [Lepidopterella palustris CBS 459.81]
MFSTINSISGGGQELGWPETRGPSLQLSTLLLHLQFAPFTSDGQGARRSDLSLQKPC